MRLLIFVMAIFLSCAPVYAQSVDPSKLEDIAEQQKQQSSLQAEIAEERQRVNEEIKDLRKDLISLSQSISSLESQSIDLNEKQDQLNAEFTRLTDDISQNRESIGKLLAALQRIEANPPPAIAMRPQDAKEAAKTSLLISGLNEQLNARAIDLNVKLEALSEVQTELDANRRDIEKNRADLEVRKAEIDKKVLERSNLEATLSEDYERARQKSATLAAEANSLRELIAKLESEAFDITPRIKPDPLSAEKDTAPQATPRKSLPPAFLDGDIKFAQSRGRLIAPVTGKLVQRYSQAHPGLSVETISESQVLAPTAGRVEFAGPFKNYDNVVIMNVGDGYFLLLTGLGSVTVQSDMQLSAGEPVGLMPVNSQSKAKLYIEVRQNQKTIDPLPWFGTRFAKPTGS